MLKEQRLIEVNHYDVKQGKTIRQRIAEEEKVRQRVDEDGTRWTKVYFGGGAHFRNWLSQFVELRGEENVKVEEADSTGFQRVVTAFAGDPLGKSRCQKCGECVTVCPVGALTFKDGETEGVIGEV